MHGGAGFKAGHIAIIGRPNTGKSTLVNAIAGQKISIVSRRPQTTRRAIQGIKTTARGQLVFIDTPGYQGARNAAVNRLMNQHVVGSLSACDAVLWMCSARQWQAGDERIFSLLDAMSAPVILVLNKVDQIKDKRALLPIVARLRALYPFAEIIPMSARKTRDVKRLEQMLYAYMPRGERIYAADALTNASVRFIIAEYLREQIFKQLGDELPYQTAVTIEHYQQQQRCVLIHAVIWIERAAHKAIIIGEQGARLRCIGQAARRQMQALLDKNVFLRTWIAVRKNWTDDIRALRQLGYSEPG